MNEKISYLSYWANYTYFLPILAIFQFQTQTNVISMLRVKFVTDKMIFVDFTGGDIFSPCESSQFQVLKKTGVKFGLISKFSRYLNFCFYILKTCK